MRCNTVILWYGRRLAEDKSRFAETARARFFQLLTPRRLFDIYIVAKFDWFFGIPWFLRPSRIGSRNSLLLGLTLGASFSLSLTGLALYFKDAWKRSLRRRAEKRVIEVKGREIVNGVEGLIGAARGDGSPECRRAECHITQVTPRSFASTRSVI